MLVIETGKDRNSQYNETIFTEHVLSIQPRENCRHPRANRIFIVAVQKRKFTSAKEKQWIKRALYFSYGKEHRKSKEVPYKSRFWQPCKYLCSQVRKRLTAEDIVTGELGMCLYLAQHMKLIYMFHPCSASPGVICTTPHMYIHTDLRASHQRKSRALEVGVTAPYSSAPGRLWRRATVGGKECRSKSQLSGVAICIFASLRLLRRSDFCDRLKRGWKKTEKSITQ